MVSKKMSGSMRLTVHIQHLPRRSYFFEGITPLEQAKSEPAKNSEQTTGGAATRIVY
jgi:hypothetical protein